MLLLLYESILFSLFCDWIQETDLCCLDSAVCNKLVRSKLLAILNKCFIVNRNECSNSDLSWVELRGLKLKRLIYDQETTDKELLHSHHLSFVELKYITDEIFHDIPHSVDILSISIGSKIPSSLHKFGSMVTHINLDVNMDENYYSKLVALCPNLKSVSCNVDDDSENPILPLIDYCCLDKINNCMLSYLIERKPSDQVYWCNLRRSTMPDETSVCLGEGKYYHVTAIRFDNKEPFSDIDSLCPFLSRIESLVVCHTSVALAASLRCRCLTVLNVTYLSNMVDEILVLIKNSPCLVELKLDSPVWSIVNGTKLVHEAALCCPQLKSCKLNNVSSEHETIRQLLKFCAKLDEFQCPGWVGIGILDFAVGITELNIFEIFSLSRIEKKGRLRDKLMTYIHLPQQTFVDILRQNPGLRDVGVYSRKYINGPFFDSLADLLPQLRSISIWDEDRTNGEYLRSLTRCPSLTSIYLDRVNFSLSLVEDLFKNRDKLMSLTINNSLTLNGTMVSFLALSCPNLKSLTICDNKVINGSHIIVVLQKCLQLSTLTLTRCPKVSSVILPFIRSPPLTGVVLLDCNIDHFALDLFSKIKSLNIRIDQRHFREWMAEE